MTEDDLLRMTDQRLAEMDRRFNLAVSSLEKRLEQRFDLEAKALVAAFAVQEERLHRANDLRGNTLPITEFNIRHEQHEQHLQRVDVRLEKVEGFVSALNATGVQRQTSTTQLVAAVGLAVIFAQLLVNAGAAVIRLLFH